MTVKLVITEQAHADIQQNALWWAERHSAEQSRKWYRAVYRQLESIPEMPASHPLARENAHFSLELRETNIGLGRGGYRAIFTIIDQQTVILALRHNRQDAFAESDLK